MFLTLFHRTAMFSAALALLSGVTPLAAQNIITLAGNGTAFYNGDGGPATSAAMNAPKGIAVAPNGVVYIADSQNHVVRKVDPKTNQISTYAGTGTTGYSGDGGQARTAQFSNVLGLALDQAGNLYITDGSNNRRIRKVTPAGVVTTVAGNGVEGSGGDGGAAVNALVGVPTALAIDAAGNLYFTDDTPSCQCVRKIDTNGNISRVAGNGVAAYAGDGGQATLASLNFPLGIAIDASGNIYVADTGNYAIRKITKSGIITTVAGNGASGFAGDGGPAAGARFDLPSDVAVDVFGNIYVADSGNNRVRRIDTNGTITTIAGTGGNSYSGDNGPAAAATLNHPWGLAADADGAIYISDDLNNVVRKIPSSNVGPPSLPSSSAVNAASFVANQAVAAGSYVAIFGSNFSAATIPATNVPLPGALGDTWVTVNGETAPLYFVSPGQINIQVPFDIPNGTATIAVNRGATTSAPQLMGVSTYGPGLFMVGGSTTQGIVVHAADFSLVTPANPARRNEYLGLYATGLGPLTIAQQAGRAAPSAEPLPRTVNNPTVTLGNQVMVLSYSGLAPTLVGVYQINFQVPASMPSGNQTLLISVGGVNSNTAVVPVQ